MYEKFTNDDYNNLDQQDFRTVRYKKDDLYIKEDELFDGFPDEPFPKLEETTRKHNVKTSKRPKVEKVEKIDCKMENAKSDSLSVSNDSGSPKNML